ncbi:MAG: hypothetical protein QOE19_3926 [Actinomycetota bacterium]|nr:hypothetical protein [Actinomycetota bacterium]MDQ1669716.1 hypothetical protein [Actinomycetota bacterium]
MRSQRIVLTLYVVLIVAGLAYFILLGVTHR